MGPGPTPNPDRRARPSEGMPHRASGLGPDPPGDADKATTNQRRTSHHPPERRRTKVVLSSNWRVEKGPTPGSMTAATAARRTERTRGPVARDQIMRVSFRAASTRPGAGGAGERRGGGEGGGWGGAGGLK